MAKNPELKKETLESSDERVEKVESSKEVSEAVNAGRSSFETIEGLDGAEAMGNVSEKASEDKSHDLGSSGGNAAAQQNNTKAQDDIKAKLLNSAPSPRVMKRQIKAEIEKEINYLHKKAMKMMKNPSSTDFFEMSNTLSKIRELKRILSGLLKLSLEGLKSLWLRYVHGIM